MVDLFFDELERGLRMIQGKRTDEEHASWGETKWSTYAGFRGADAFSFATIGAWRGAVIREYLACSQLKNVEPLKVLYERKYNEFAKAEPDLAAAFVPSWSQIVEKAREISDGAQTKADGK